MENNMYLALNLFIIVINFSLIVAQNATTQRQPPLTPTLDPNRHFKKPDKNVVGETFAKDLTDWLFTGCWGGNNNQRNKCSPYRTASNIEYPGYDGWYNNVGRPELGAVDTPLLRRLPAAYEDGVYKPSGSKRPEPLEISEKLLSGKIGSKSRTGRNALLVFFGQQVVEEILDAQRPACPPEYINIKIPKNHRYRINKPGHTEMPVLRTRYDHRTGHSPNNPRQQLNEITPFLDGGLIYGTSKAWSDVLRTSTGGILQEDGQLASSDFPLYPDYNTVRLPMANPPPPIHHHQYVSRHYTESVTRYFKLGNPRGNENPFLLTFGIIWFRWHNFVASHIKRLNPKWSSDKVYNEARKWVIAVQQHIVVNEWLPSWLDDRLPAYEGYNPNIDPQIDQFFQSAAFRFGHTLVPPGVYLRNYGRNNCSLESHPIRTCNNYWMSQNSLHANLTRIKDVIDVEKLLMGMAIQLCEEEDHKIVEDLRGSLFGPLEFSRRDLMALNIQRGRDHGVPDYNSARRAYGLAEVKNVSHFNRVNVTIREEFLRLYNNSFDDVDVWVGGILETGDGPGELFQRIIRDQFQRIRDGDRFWYNNTANRLFTDKEVERLEQLSFYDVLMCTTKMDWNDIPKNPFRVPTTANGIHPSCINNKIVKEGRCTNGPCFHADQIDEYTIETCTEPGTYDFFSNSGISFIFTFLGVSTLFFGFITLIGFKIQFKDKKSAKENVMYRKVDHSDNIGIIHTASEWQEPRASLRCVILVPNVRKNQLEVKNQLGHLIRAVDFPSNSRVTIYCASDSHYTLIRVHHSYDLVLKFDSDFLRSAFIKAFEKFISEISTSGDARLVQMITNTTHAALLKQAITKKHRQKKLEMFFRVVFAQAFHIAHTEEEILKIDSTVAREVIYTELTIIEFAEALSMRPDAEFVKKIFHLVDKDRNGFISFREFVDMLVIFLKGSAEEKMKLMFDMYDINGTGRLKREEFSNMLRSFMETVNADVTDDELEALVQSMMYHADLANKERINLQDFQQILSDFNDKFNYAELEFNVPTDGKSNRKLHAGVKTVRSTFIGEVQKTVESLYADPSELQSRVEGKVESVERDAKEEKINSEIIDKDEKIVEEIKRHSDDYWYPIMKYLANKRLQIFWACLYTLFLLGIFAERVYYYSVQREHSGLRRILGYGLTITRGAASAMMFTYSTLLIMMCHNTITILRTTTLQFYIPFDSAIEMHKYIACWALVFTALHTIGHGFNFYHISTQTADDLTCLFRNYFHATHELPKFHYWCWGTMTGITGVFLTILTGLIFVCSLPMVRKSFYNWFSFVHSLYPAFYILMVLHGSGRLVQEPYFHYFFLGPAILFILDKVVAVTRTTTEIPILKAEILPSDVTCITFLRPLNFQYKSGQWIKIACPALQTNEYHPFTLSSAPHETNLSIHVRAVGPWTTNIREKLDLCAMSNENLPMIHIDGPYGEGHQDWDKYQVAIMVGGGIGVTPFASILKDIVFKSNCKLNFGCKKVYFLWVTRTQKQFEWMVDILRELEKVDVNKTVSTHIFVTQFYQKFDLRTILLYICERHFQKISNKSLFTGLKAVTHFGRPKFSQFFLSIQKLHPTANKIGVFSCGTPAMTQAVDAACKAINLTEINDTLFQHHYKSF
ncbi:dual oxidase 2-like [Temnothorax curvispinosus]|uniref:NAD(P)H oxidase (H2O2-forming) n=1 Tax=Temnothorax curvispinosus TaxID=300111 RepID=A0A6J1RJ44_9HYME|nr:dual oxidase 2-like [Temnothorax curvispinosus]XP_024892990.1 dual oxidase 2-like [Temnothorax curvispinosus]